MLGEVSFEEMQKQVVEILLTHEGRMLSQDIMRAQDVYWFHQDLRDVLKDLVKRGIVRRMNINHKKVKAYELVPSVRRELESKREAGERPQAT